MWKRPRTWVTLAVMVWLNFVAWSIRTSLKQSIGAIQLYQHKVGDGTEYTTLAPSYFFFDSVWFSYVAAVFIGFALPIILARFLPLLWHRRRKMGGVAAWLILLVICNALAWEKVTFLDEMAAGIPLYKTVNSYSNIEYTGIVPRIRVVSWATAYALSYFVSLAVPLAALWLWRRKQKGQPLAPGVPNLPLGPGVLALLVLLTVFNVLAWDWKESSEKNDIAIVLRERTTEERIGFTPYTVTYYSGIAAGIRFAETSTSILASFFVGEILPLLIAPALFRRRRPLAIPLPPVTGAPR